MEEFEKQDAVSASGGSLAASAEDNSSVMEMFRAGFTLAEIEEAKSLPLSDILQTLKRYQVVAYKHPYPYCDNILMSRIIEMDFHAKPSSLICQRLHCSILEVKDAIHRYRAAALGDPVARTGVGLLGPSGGSISESAKRLLSLEQEKHRQDEAKKMEIVRLCENGLTLATIMAQLNVTRTRVKAVLAEAKTKIRRERKYKPLADRLDTSQIIEMNKQGYSLATIGKRFSCSSTTVSQILRSSGVVNPTGPKVVSLAEGETAEVVRLFGAGMSLDDIEQKMGRSKRTIRTAIKGTKDEPAQTLPALPLEGNSASKQQTIGYLRCLKDEGYSAAEIARRMGMKMQTVHHLLRRHKLAIGKIGNRNCGRSPKFWARKLVALSAATKKIPGEAFASFLKMMRAMTGKTVREFAQMLHCPQYQLASWEHGISVPEPYRYQEVLRAIATATRLTSHVRALRAKQRKEQGAAPRVIALYLKGSPIKAIAAQLGLDYQGTATILKQANLPKRESISSRVKEYVINMYRDGKTRTEIATKLECSVALVGMILFKNRVLRA